MKELQNFVYRHMDALRHHKRYLAMLTALSMLVTFIVPLILIEPADSMTGILVCKKVVHTHNAECYVGDTLICDIEEHIHTNECYKKVSILSLKGEGESSEDVHDDNKPLSNAGGGLVNGSYVPGNAHLVVGKTDEYYNPATLPLYTLLFGELNDEAKGQGKTHWVDPKQSLEDNLELVDDEYFLGFASDFCAFIESDFTAFDADAEGRMFVGGDLIFKGIPDGNKWNYQVGAGDYGQFTPILQTDEYGHLTGFASGIIGGKVYRLGTMTTGAYASLGGDQNKLLPEGRDPRHTDGNDVFLYPEEGAYKRFIVGNLKDSLHYDEDGAVADISYGLSCNHLYATVNCDICKKSDSDHSYLGEVNELSQFYIYDDVRTILEKTFDTLRARSLSLASIESREAVPNGGTLTLDATNVGDAKTVYFKVESWDNITKVDIKVPDNRIKKTEESPYTNDEETITELDLNIIVSCDDKEIDIYGTQTLVNGLQISKRGEANSTNNHPLSSNILYNFYNATSVTFNGGCNFNGTVFAPNANATSPEKCPGHLSGALIAKSFYGGLEFGYRPYRGGVDIFGMTSGYAVPVNKVDQSGDPLPGALFAIKEGGKFVSLFESGSGTNFAALPSRVDFTGGTYRQEIVDQQPNVDRYYAGNEVAGEKLTANVTITLYKDSSCSESNSIESGETLENVLTKFYLEANQEVDFDYNENIRFEGPVAGRDGKLVYTVYLIKPVTNVEITARNKGDNTNCASATVNFMPMTLTTSADVYKVGEPITLTVGKFPTGDTISYKYFVNGNFIDLNGDGQDNDYTPDISCTYTPSAAGDLLFSVEAYVEINGQRYNIARATDKKYIANTLPDNMAIELYTYEGENIVSLNNNTIKSGEQLIIRAKNIPNYASVTYSFNGSSNYNTNDNGDIVFDTSNIIGRDLTVKVTVSGENETVDLYSTVTVDFPDMELKVLDNDKETEITEYVVNSDTNDKLNFSVSGIPNGATVKYYFKDTELTTDNNSASITKTVIGENIPVRAVVSLNGMEKTLYGSVTGKYNDGLKLNIEQQAGYIAGNEIRLNITNAPNGANVVFSVYDSSGVLVKTLGTETVNNGEAWSSYTPEKSGSYYFKATMTYGDNPVKELTSETITVVPVTLNGELSVTPSQVNTGNEVELKVYGATIGADVTFTVKDQNGNVVHTISGLKVNDNGECTGTYKPTQAGSYTVEAAISKGDTPRNLQKSFTAIENTSALSGTFTLSKETITPGSSIDIIVNSPNNGAVVNIKITSTNGYSRTQSGNIGNGTYSWTLNETSNVGVYTVSVELVQGTSSQPLGEQKFTVSNGNDASGEISVSPESIVIGNSITVNITNAPVGANVAFKYYYYDSDISQYVSSPTSATIGDEGTYNLTFSPAIVGKYTVKATITTANGSVKEVETSFYAHAVFEIDNDGACVAGQWHNISVSGIEKQTISSVQQFTIEGQTVSEYNIVNPSEENPEGTKPYISFRTSEQYTGGTYNLYLKIQLSGGAVTEYRKQITNSAATDSASYSLRNTSNLKNASFLKSVNILADESTVSDNLIEITPEEAGERISSVRLTFPDSANAKNNTFKLAVTFTDSDNNSYTMYYDKNKVAGENPAYIDILTSEIPGDADIDEENITKISITSVAGSIAVDKCYPTYVKAENQITKTYTKGFTLNPNEQKEIVIENWLETLDSITFNLESDGEIFYALIGTDETETLVSGSAKSENGNKKIEITGINDNIKKIKIFTKQESPLTVKDYTIIGFTGDKSYNKEELQNNEWDVINYYTLVEQQAPVGYFKEETVYTIEVKETVDLASLSVDGKPTKVLTTISVKDKNGIVVFSYSVNTEYDGDNKKITILDNDPEKTDVSFTLTENNGVVTVKGSSDEVLNWDTSKPGSHEYGDKEYYLDPAAMMIVPVPESIEYTNRKALLFRKVDDGGAIVKEVMIQMHEYVKVLEEGEEKWKWQEVSEWKWSKNETSECLLSIDGENPTIKTGTYYKFHESDAGGKYELTDDIYMIRDSENTNEIHYWTVDRDNDEAPTKRDEYNVLDLTKDNVIRMSNYKIPGVKLSLSKTDLETGSVITGVAQDAVFNLYANDGTLLQKDITVTNGHIELNLLSVTDTEGLYVEEGYLKPGTYFLREMKAPTNYEASVSDFYFSVLVDKNGVYSVKGEESTPGVVRLTETQSDGTVHRVVKFQQKALQRLATLDPYTPVIQFKFNTSGNEKGYGNAKFSAIVNGTTTPPESTAYPSGCDSHTNGISFQSEEVIVQLSINQLCALFGVAVENFSTITEFSINCWNSTTISDVDFYPLENPIYYTVTDTEFKILEAGLHKITDGMITSGTDKIFNINISSKYTDNPDWGNGCYFGAYNGSSKETNYEAIKCTADEITISLTAKEMLTNLGITYTDENLTTDFRKLSEFGIKTKNTSKITDVTFNVPADDNTNNTTPELQIPSITVDGTNVKVSNEGIKNVMKLRVEKKWQGDNEATELRQPVTVTLKRRTGETGSYAPYTPSDEVSGLQELSSENSWTYTWENLPRFVNENDPENSVKYYYTVEETPITGYIGSLVKGYENFNESGTITLTNTANVIDIPVKKSWNSNGYLNVIPDSVMFKLQASLDGKSWIDLPQKTIVVTKPDNWDGTTAWEGKFENLPVGYEYKAVECELPYDHWTVKDGSVTSVTATKTDKEEEMASGFVVENTYNPPEGGLTVNKQWIGDTAADRPEQLKLKVYRTIAKPYYEETDAPYVEEGNDYKSDYARLLQHSLYFYDANMCGADVSANSALAWRSNCHLEDEVQGGYHDAGDHVMFGLPQGYTATMLSWAYLEFFKEDEGATKSIDSADKAHLKLILKRFYDFFVNSVHYDSTGAISEILVQKGYGNVDHLLWCSPETQKQRDSEMIWSSTSGANIAAEYAAALALGHIIFGGEGNDYLEVAEKLYTYAGKTSAFQAGDSEGNYYQDGDKEDDMQLAAAWLYEATGKKDDSPYKNARSNSPGQLQWDDVSFAAACAYARQDNDWSNVINKIETEYMNNSFYYIHEWGTARFNAIAQTAVLIAAKNLKENPTNTHTYPNEDGYKKNKNKTLTYNDIADNYVNWAKGQMNKILGDNNWKDTISENGCTGGTVDRTGLPVCLVTNFAPDEIYSPQAPHHRAASGWETHEDYKNNCGYNTENSHQLIGALAGGPAFKTHTDQAQMNSYQHDHPRTTHNYIDDLHDYCCNEVAIDYNAGLVGAAAGLFYFTGTGERSTKIEGVEIEAMGGTPEYTVAYAPSSLVSSNAYTLERVSIQSGYNMVPLRRTAVSVLADEPYTLDDTELAAVISGSGWSIPTSIAGKSISSIEVTVSGVESYHTLQVYINAAYNNCIYASNPPSKVVISSVDGFFSNVYNSSQPLSNKITLLHIPSNGMSIDSVTLKIAGDGTPSIKGASEMYEGETKEYTLDGASNWTVSNLDLSETDLASIDQNGNLSSIANVNENTAIQISAQLNGKTITKDVVIKPITISGASSMGLNKSINLTIDSSIDTSRLNWKTTDTSPGALASINANGRECTVNSSPAQTGTINIGLYIVDSNGNHIILASKSITVTSDVVQSSIKLRIGGSDSSVNMNIGETKNIQIENGSASSYNFSEEGIVVISNGNVVALKNGEVEIKAVDSNDAESNGVIVTVNASSMQINDIYNNNVGDTPELSVSNAPNGFADNNASYEIIEGKDEFALLNGKQLRLLKPGNYRVKATLKRNVENIEVVVTAEKTFTVNPISASINVADEISVNSETNLSLNGKPDNAVVTWSIKEETDIATIEDNKLVTGNQTGTITLVATIKAKDYKGAVVAAIVEKTIEIIPAPMSLSITSATIEVKDEIEIEASNVPESYTLSWSSNEFIEIVETEDNTVLIKGLKAGAGTITATATPMTRSTEGAVSVTADITVTPIAVPNGYYLIDKVFYSDQYLDGQIDIPLSSNVLNSDVGMLIFEFTSTSSNPNYCGEVQINGENRHQFRANNDPNYVVMTDEKATITLNPAERIKTLAVKSHYNSFGDWQNNAKLKRVYIFGKVDGPTIVDIPTGMIVGEEATLRAVGFTNTENIQWTVEGGNATIEDGVFKPTSKGTFTIKATNGSETATTTIEVARIPIKIGFNSALDEVTKTVKYTDTVTLHSSETVKYEIVSEARSNIGELVKIENNMVSVIDKTSFGTNKVTVTIQGYVTDGEEKVVSNQVQVTFVGQIYITGISEIAPNKSTTLKVKNALGAVAWDIVDDEAYNVSDADANGIITVTDDEGNIILKLDSSNGKITAGEASGTVNIQARADGETAEHTVVVKDLPMQPIIPTEGKELVEEIELTGESWSYNLENLPVEDEKGNIYYYYVEEYAYKKSASDKDWTLIYTPESLGFIHANGSYMPVSYNENGNSLSVGKTSSFTVGNKATEKPQGQLPSTGGSGARTYYYFGGALMLLGIAGFTSLKRRERKRRKEE